jgi:hypothetical protein
MMFPRVLVACPTAEVKDYALEQYLEAYYAYQWENKDLFIVDNTIGDDGAYHRKLLDLGINSHHINLDPQESIDKVSRSWPNILAFAWACGFDYIFSNEIDVICPPDTIRKLVDVAEVTGAFHVAHTYPYRNNRNGHMTGIGMNLLRRELFPPDTKCFGGKWHSFETMSHSYPQEKQLPYVLLYSVVKGVKHLEHPDPRYQHPKGH